MSTYKQAVLALRSLSTTPGSRSWPGTTASASRPPMTTAMKPSRCSLRASPPLRGALFGPPKAAGHTDVILHAPRSRPIGSLPPAPPAEWTCGGAASTATTAGTSRKSPRRTVGRCGLRRAPRPRARHHPARADPDLLIELADWVDDGQLGLGDLGYEGEADLLRIPIKKPADGELTVDQQAYNAVHGALRCLGERANSLLKTTFKALRRWRGCPWRIGQVVAAALVVLHHEHRRTT